jgi:uncharacterized protein YbbK (DUF523 family)
VFLSHCLLNENTRYLGGACRPGCVREIVQQCLDRGIGMVQMPCPEQLAWGGVIKRHLLAFHGSSVLPPKPVVMAYTRVVFRRLARSVAAQIADYVRSGYSVVGIVAVDGSPSCGLRKTVDIPGFLGELPSLDPAGASVDRENAIIRRHVVPGQGLFVIALERALRRRGLNIPFQAHDLFEELDGRSSTVELSD